MLADDIPIIPKPSEEFLNTRQRTDYEEHRTAFLEWLSVFGKEPERAEGYSHAVVKNTAYRTDKFYRWVWEQETYTTNIAHDHADAYLRHLAGDESSGSHKAKCVKAMKRLFKWHHHEKGGSLWEPEITFSDSTRATQPRDFLTEDERKAIWEAALEYGSIPAYNTVTPEQRARKSGPSLFLNQQLQTYLLEKTSIPVPEHLGSPGASPVVDSQSLFPVRSL